MKRPVVDWMPNLELETNALIAIGTTNRNSLVIAGPGAGKTEMLAQRASYLLQTRTCAAPQRILALSFKNDSANNLRDRVKLRCGAELSHYFDSKTFASWAKSLLDRFRLALPEKYRPTHDYYIDKDLDKPSKIKSHLLSIAAATGRNRSQIDRKTDPELKDFFRNKILAPLPFADEEVLPSWSRYWWESALHGRKHSLLHFSNIDVLAELLLRSNPQLISSLQATYSFVFLDEFQDTTPSQYRLLETAFKGSAAILTAVGDHKQSIMGFAGADKKIIERYRLDFDAEVFDLIENHRSGSNLVNIQRHLVQAFDPGGLMPAPPKPGPADEGECYILNFFNNQIEAEHMARLIREWIEQEGVPAEEICVLVRYHSEAYTGMLLEQLQIKGIRYRALFDDIQNLLAEPLVVTVVDFFRLASSSQNAKNWNRLLALFLRLRGIANDEESAHQTRRAAAELSKYVGDFRTKLLAIDSESGIYKATLQAINFIGKQAFCRYYEQYLQSSFFQKTAQSFASELARVRNEANSWEQTLDDFLGIGAVHLMTIHKSKGLEYHSVVLIGLEDDAFWGFKKGEGAEEKCSFFVAFSRAKQRVVLTYAGERVKNQITTRQQTIHVQELYGLLERAGVRIESVHPAPN